MDQQETVFQYIKKAIIENRLPPGTRLREIKLAEIFGVKRGLIRKVLNRLVNEKLVDHQQNIGAQVAIPTLKDGQDLFATRQILEQAVIQTLCKKITDKQIAYLEEYLKNEQLAYRQGDHKLGLRWSIDFHLELAKMTGNSIIEEFLTVIINRTPLVLLSQFGESPPDSCVNHEHFDIVKALSQRDSETAVKLMQKHLSHLQNKFKIKPQQTTPDLEEVFSL